MATLNGRFSAVLLITFLGFTSVHANQGLTYSDDEFGPVVRAGSEQLLLVGRSLLEETQRQAAELRSQQEALERANRFKSDFLASMSHEIRTPLNVIMGYAGMVLEGMLGKINAEQQNALKKTISHSQDLLVMVTDILQATQLEAREVELKRGEASLKNLLDEIRTAYEMPLDKKAAALAIEQRIAALARQQAYRASRAHFNAHPINDFPPSGCSSM